MDEAPFPPPGWTFDRRKLIGFVLLHLLCLAALLVPFSWDLLALCLGLYALRILAITVGYHRYFSHKAFRTSRPFQLLLALAANTTFMKGPLTWAAAHRHHHRTSDTPADLHSPGRAGFWFAHMGWFLTRDYLERELAPVTDLERFPELRWCDRNYWVPTLALAVGLYAWGGWPAVVWGSFVSTILTWHGTFTINSLAHRIGRQRFDTGDESKNSFLLAVITLGEGWHNNHHHQMWSARQGFRWWELDPSYALIWALARLRIVWDVKQPRLEPASERAPAPAEA